MVTAWSETTLPTLLSNYSLENVYNADEYGLCYQFLPNKSYQLKTEKCSGGKHNKISVTGLAAANAGGSKLPMFVLGKAKKPRCLKNIKTLPCRYRAQKKSWMDGVLFKERVKDLNKKFESKKRKVALIIGNCPVHPVIDNLSRIKLVFLPPKTTSVSQSMDQGITRCLKANYRKRLVKLILRSLDSNKPLSRVSLLTALQLLATAWNEVSQATIVNCFKKAKISGKDQTIAINDEDDPFKEINKDLQELREKDSSLVPESMTAEDLASADDAVITRESTLTDEEMMEEATKIDDDGVEDIEDENDEELVAPSARDVEKSLEILKSLSLFSEPRGGQMQDLINKFETLLIREKVEKSKQVSITSYFVKEK